EADRPRRQLERLDAAYERACRNACRCTAPLFRRGEWRRRAAAGADGRADAGGASALPREMMVGRTRVVEISSRSGIGAEQLADLDLSDDLRILFKTSNSRLWASPEFHTD